MADRPMKTEGLPSHEDKSRRKQEEEEEKEEEKNENTIIHIYIQTTKHLIYIF
jgi:sugar phosphate permease